MTYSYFLFENKVKAFQKSYDFFHPKFELWTKEFVSYPNESWFLIESNDYDSAFSPGELVVLAEYDATFDVIDWGGAIYVTYEGLVDVDGDRYYDGIVISESYGKFVLTDEDQYIDYTPFSATVTLDKVSIGGTAFVPPTLPPPPNPNELIIGTSGNDALEGLDGNDTLKGLGGDDVLFGGTGRDLLVGGAGNDVLVGEFDFDELLGGTGDDFLDGGSGGDRLDGGFGRDIASYVTARSKVRADLEKAGSNTGDAKGDLYISIEDVWGSSFNDKIFGDSDSNILYGDNGSDTLTGRSGNDRLYGGTGNDTLLGGNGADKIFGEVGRDRLVANKGKDTLKGGEGLDTFAFKRGDGRNKILDFQDGSDLIEVGNGASRFAQINVTKVKAGVLVEFSDVDIILKGLSIDEVDRSDFQFV